jgi:hypothetical protein
LPYPEQNSISKYPVYILALDQRNTTFWRLPMKISGVSNRIITDLLPLWYESPGNVYGSMTNTGLFENLQNGAHWSVTEYSPDTDWAWNFNFSSGYQGLGDKEGGIPSLLYGIAVRPGDVSAVPIPGAVWLLGSGLAGLVGLRRKFRK